MPELWCPHVGQKKAVKYLLEHAVAALLADVGVGKTSIVYAAFKMLKKRGIAKKMLVIAPLRVTQLVWPAEARKWTDFSGLRVEVLHGPDKEAALFRDADVYVINPEGLSWLLDEQKSVTRTGKVTVVCDPREFKKLGFDTLVIDELTKFKAISTNRSKTLRMVSDTFSRRWGLTGTPVSNGLMDLFGQMLILDGGRSLGRYITHYRRDFFDLGYDGLTWKLKPDAEERIYDRIRPVALRLAASDYIDMPELVENRIEIDLPPVARRIYNELEDDLIAELEDGLTVTASNAGVKSIKIRQVAAGGVYLEDFPLKGNSYSVRRTPRPWVWLHDAKTEALAELVEGLQGSPILVAYEFQHDLERIRGEFGADVPVIGKGVSDARVKEIEAAWNRGELPVLCGHPQSVGHGLNLQHAGNHICFYSPIWNLEHRDQFIGRIRRQGSRHQTIFSHTIVARNTIESRILRALDGKASAQNSLLEALRDMKRTGRQ